jgi:hypothetical protein
MDIITIIYDLILWHKKNKIHANKKQKEIFEIKEYKLKKIINLIKSEQYH